MKNSASNLSEKQALQVQADELLLSITDVLSQQHYDAIVHQRISQYSKQPHDNHTVYQGLTRAQHQGFGQVIIKWEISASDQRSLTGLSREITALKKLKELYPHNDKRITPTILANKTLDIRAFDSDQQLLTMTLPHHSQGNLASYIQQALSSSQKQQLIISVAHLIADLHQYGWLHNDLKPSNILQNTASDSFQKDDSLSWLLIDFALAQRIKSVSQYHNHQDNYQDNHQNEFSAGTPAYLAPERWQGHSATVASDIYAFGIIMYEIAVGVRPFNIALQSTDPLKEWALQHCQQAIPVLPTTEQAYQTIINKALAKKIESRYNNMPEIIKDLQRIAKI